MIAIDTNLLVYAHREDSSWYEQGNGVIKTLAEGREGWAIPWPCIHEFMAVVTHPRIYDPPTPLPRALEQVEAWIESPSLELLAESGRYWEMLSATMSKARVMGAQIHDARVAALCLHHGIRELWTADRDFGRFKSLTVRNPLVD